MKPIIIKRSTIYLIWVIPIIAIIISGIMLFNEYAKMGESVVIIFKDARGFKQDETPIKYKGILIGVVKDIEVDPQDLNKFVITAKIKNSFVKYLTEGARFWKVSPKLKPTEFTGLSTLFSGTYIEFSPATSDPQKLSTLKTKRRFYGYEEEPKTNVTYFKLYGEDGSLIEGAPVLFKNFIVGNITKKSLKGKNVEYVISISNKFAPLVKVDSHFWKIAPVDIKASIPDLQFKVNNALNFFFGGVQFDSPENSVSVCMLDKDSKEFQVCNEKGFYLFPSRGDTEYSLNIIKLVLKNAHKIQSSLKLVYYKGDVAGKVVSSNYLVEKDIRYLFVRMKRKYENFLSYKSVFWIEKPSIENISIQSLIKGTHIEFSFYNEKANPRNEYILYHSRPYENVEKIVLKSLSNVGLKVGDYIFYGRTIIGEVISEKIKNGKEIYNAIIYKKYKYLLNTSPVFYKKNGFDGTVSMEEVSFNLAPLKELFLGGVALLKGEGETKKGNNTFYLFKNKKDAEEYNFLNTRGLRFVLYSKTLNGIYKGIPIFYNGLKIGKVYNVDFNQAEDIFILKAFVDSKYRELVSAESVFYLSSGMDVRIGFSDIEIKTANILSLLKGAIILKNYSIKGTEPKEKYRLLTTDELEEEKYIKAFLICDRAYGLKKNSPVVFKGVIVGKVKDMRIEKNNLKIIMLIDKQYNYLLTSQTKFYIENTKLSVNGIENLSSSFFGSKIKIAYKNSPKKTNIFQLAGVNPSSTVYRDGLRIIVIAPEIVSFSTGSPVLNRGVKVGEIENIEFTKDFKSLKLTVFFENKYKKLVKDTTRFREIKPLSIKTGFIYAKVDVKSISTLIKGGLELINNNGGSPVEDGHTFFLETSKKKSY